MEKNIKLLMFTVGILCASFAYHLYIDHKNMDTIGYNLVYLNEMVKKQVEIDSLISVRFEEVVKATNVHHDALDTLLRNEDNIEWFERPLNYEPRKNIIKYNK